MATIRKRLKKDGTPSYRVEVRLKGFPTESATFARKTDAKKWANSTEAAIRENRYFKTAESKKHTFYDLVKRYIETVAINKKDKQKRVSHLKWWQSEIGAYRLFDITPMMIAECRDKLLSETTRRGRLRSPSTVVRYMATLSHAFTTAVNEWGWIDESPMRKVSKPKEPKGRTRFLGDDTTKNGKPIKGERCKLLEACKISENPHLYTIVVLALSTGMRQGEIMNLTWPDVDLSRRRITLMETKNGEIRVVPLAGHALELLEKHNKEMSANSELLFPGKIKKEKPMDLRIPWAAAINQAEISDFRFHDLRHSAASYLAMNGASLAEIAEVLGHKTFQMVKRYSHLSEQHTESVVASMNDKIFGGSND